MKKKRLLLATITLVALTGLFAIKIFPGTKSVVPDISVNTIDGQVLQLDSYAGQAVLVTFWATSCSICIQEMPHLASLYKELNNKGLEIISIAMYYDPPNRVVELSKQKEIPYPVALDIEGKTAQAFGNINVTPTSFLIGPNGTIIQKQIGELNVDQLRIKIKQLLKNNQTTIS